MNGLNQGRLLLISNLIHGIYLMLMMTHLHGKASILAVGSELTSGQITNRNAAWISQKLVDLGIEVVLHETVADDRQAIEAALNHCSENSQMIFVTGGLGPTSDDFTRDVVSQWLNRPLEFHEDVSKKIQDRLSLFNIPVASSNRQQCYFPAGSKVLSNPEGTAPGFTALTNRDSGLKRIFVLPGPPHEIKAIWLQGIDGIVRELCPELKPVQLFTWQCMGKSEAELGEITEKALEGSGLQTGYRAHRPFVEVKVWCPQDQISENQKWLQKLSQAIGPWVFTTQGEDLAETLLKKLKSHSRVELYDSASAGFMAQRFSLGLKDKRFRAPDQSFILKAQWFVACESPLEELSRVLAEHNSSSPYLVMVGFNRESEGAIGMKLNGQTRQVLFQSPYRREELIDRTRSMMVEVALKQWSDWLDT